MKIGKLRLNLTSIPLIVFAVSICLTCSGNFGAKGPSENEMQQRADIIRIDSMQQFGKLERPAVTFLHQKHTEAVTKKNKDCKTCHLIEKDRLVFKYMRLEDSSPQAVLDQIRGQGLAINHFEITTPSLHSIFLHEVGGNHE